MKIKQLDIEGFRSFRKTSWHPGDLNVIIGPNGSGKSNLLRFLELLSLSAQGRLGKHVQSLGGMDPIVWDGKASSIKCVLKTTSLNDNRLPEQYELEMLGLGGGSAYRIGSERLTNYREVRSGSQDEPFIFLDRTGKAAVIFDASQSRFTTPEEFVSDEETLLSLTSGPFTHNPRIPPFQKWLASISIYHDIHTNRDASLRSPVVSRMEKHVDPDGQNLVSVLHTLYTSDREFKRDINSAMRSAFGNDFEELIFPPASDQRVQMRIRWKSLQREQSAAEMSDGTLRFLFLLAVLATPSPSPVIAIDEPETGLHPSMLPLVAEYAIDAASRSQVILTTHSTQLLDAFGETKPVTTVSAWNDGETVLRTLDGDELDYWLKSYSLGSLFQSGELEQMS
ncbi:MAG: chromosome segregation protein SMC [Dethiosulfovibrio peptidovorans]|nr:MAG: chromosome segregation protein SMC [Dethiosulfovibrio peptidovorans]